MIKRLVPVAAAVVLGLSPNFASAAGHYNKGGKVYSSNQATNSNVMSTYASNALDFAVNNVDLAHGKGVSLAGGRINLGFEGAVQYDYVSANGFPEYITSRTVNLSDSGTRLTSAMMMPLSFQINRNLQFKSVLGAGNSKRLEHASDRTFKGHSSTSHDLAGGGVGTNGFDLHVDSAYAVYKMGSFAVFGGLMLEGLSAIDLSPSMMMAPKFHDYLEYRTTNLGVAYTMSNVYLSAAFVDPGNTATASSRLSGVAGEKIRNYNLRAGYHGMSGATKYNLDLTYLKDANDLTFINAIRDLAANEDATGSQSSAYGITAGASFNNFDVSVILSKLKKNAGLTTGAAQTDMDTSNANLWDLNVGYKVNSNARVSAFYDNNRKGHATGLPRRQYGVEGMYRVANNTDLGAALWREKKNGSAGGATVTMRNATHFAVNLSYFLG